MKFLPLIWAMLWRSRARTWLTFLSIVVAFFLFGLLQAVHASFTAGVRSALDDVLIVTYRQGTIRPLPAAYLSRLTAMKGVAAVAAIAFLPGWYQDPKNPLVAIAIDITSGASDRRVIVAPEEVKAFRELRTGALAGRDAAEKYGWKIGDKIPLHSPIPRKDGAKHWEFDLVGFLDYDETVAGARPSSNFILVNFDYFDAAVQFPGWVMWYRVRIADPQQAAAIGQAIDREFLNSAFATRTQPEREFQAGFLRQFGDIGVMVRAILAAVFFTLVLIAGNAMMQAFRERIPELAVLKTVGFTDRQAGALAVGESLLLCLAAAAIGLGAAWLSVFPLRRSLDQLLAMTLPSTTLAAGIAIALVLAVVAAAVPAWKATRLEVAAALGAK
jgi:putative ABC transport system permease protein